VLPPTEGTEPLDERTVLEGTVLEGTLVVPLPVAVRLTVAPEDVE